jgi:hypothetical protein
MCRTQSQSNDVCSELVNLVDSATSFAKCVEKLTGGDNGRGCCVTFVVSRQTKDLTSTEVQNCVNLLNQLHDAGVISDGVTATERGGKKGYLHLQSCFWLPKLNRNGREVQEAFTMLVYEHAQFSGPRRHVYATVHEITNEPHVTWRTQCG